MPRQPSLSARTTLYRVKDVHELAAAIRPKYLTSVNFSSSETTVDDREALIVFGAMRKDQAAWTPRLAQISGVNVDVGTVTAAAVLLIRDENSSAWALSYGMGFQLIEPAALDSGFGMRVAIRGASPEAIQSLTRTELDYRSRTDRSSIPAGDALRGFGIGDFGEVVTRISGSAQVVGLTVGDGSISVRAADALSLPLAKSAEALVSDLDAISAALALDPKPELHALEQFVRVKDPGTIQMLEAELRATLAGEASGRLALGWPHERINDNGTPSSWTLSGTGHREEIQDDLPTIEDLCAALQAKNEDDPLLAARTVNVHLFRDGDGDEPISGAIPSIHWIFYETELHGLRYCLFDSRWYAMDGDYASRLQSHVQEIFGRTPAVQLPTWESATVADELAYNTYAAGQVQGVVLDRSLVRTTAHPRGFEACDIVTPCGDLIHVKRVPQSSAASHLIAQAVVSTEALRHDNEARVGVRAKIEAAGGQASWLPDKLSSVVLGMARERPVGVDDLFTFTQVTLSRLDSSLADGGVTLTVAPVPRT